MKRHNYHGCMRYGVAIQSYSSIDDISLETNPPRFNPPTTPPFLWRSSTCTSHQDDAVDHVRRAQVFVRARDDDYAAGARDHHGGAFSSL
jgi:hypothetical protein